MKESKTNRPLSPGAKKLTTAFCSSMVFFGVIMSGIGACFLFLVGLGDDSSSGFWFAVIFFLGPGIYCLWAGLQGLGDINEQESKGKSEEEARIRDELKEEIKQQLREELLAENKIQSRRYD